MNAGLMLISVALATSLLAGCDKTKQAGDPPKPALPKVASVPQALPLPQISPTAVASERSKAVVQGEIDPKEPAQRKAFETTK